MTRKILAVLFLLAAGAAIILKNANGELSHNLEMANLELSKSREKIATLERQRKQSEAGNLALQQLSQSCLDRERNALAEAERWRQILDDMELREITPNEKKEVPDDKTRAALLDFLDKPL